MISYNMNLAVFYVLDLTTFTLSQGFNGNAHRFVICLPT